MIAIAADHAGVELKELIVAHLQAQNLEVRDFGVYQGGKADYPDYAVKVARSVASGESEKGILVCGTGVGMSMAANKVKGIRASLCTDTFTARATRAHNDANILCLGQRVIGEGVALEIVDVWLSTPFEGGRHAVRVDKLMALESEN